MNRLRGEWPRNLALMCLLLLCAIASPRGRALSGPTIIRVGVDHTPPFYYVEAGKPVRGLAVDVMNEAAARAGFQLEWIPQLNIGLNEALRTRSVDLWPLVAVTNERRKLFYISAPWLGTDYVVVSLEDRPVMTAADARDQVVAHANLLFTVKIAKAFLPESKLLSVNTRDDALIALCHHQAVAAVLESRVLDTLLLTRPTACADASFRLTSIPGAHNELSLVANPEFSAQTRRLRDEIGKLEKSGLLSRALDKWCPFTAEGTRSEWLRKAADQRGRVLVAGSAAISILAFVLALVLARSLRLRRALKDSERLFEAFFENSPLLTFLKDGCGNFVRTSESCREAFGAEIFTKEAIRRLPKEFVQRAADQDRTCRESLRAIEVVETFPNANGEIRHWLVTKFPILLQSGDCYIGGLCLDVTEREAASRELAESESRYRELFQLNPLAAWIYDRDSLQFLKANDAAERDYGWTKREFLHDIGLPDVVRADRAGTPLDFDAIASLDADHEVTRAWWHSTRTGATRKVEATAYPVNYKSHPARVVILRDITQQNLAMELLRQGEERWQLALRNAGDGLWDWNIVSGAVFRSPRCLEMLGDLPSKLPEVRSSWLQLIHPADLPDFQRAIEAHLKCRSESFVYEYRVRQQSGDWLWVLDRGKAIWDQSGRPIRMIGSRTDINTRKLAEEQLNSDANSDALTGVANRREFDRVAECMIRNANSSKLPLTLCICDLDRFKLVNDTYGHRVGDHVLFTFASIARDTLRKSDLIARTGGDEFVFLLPDTYSNEALLLVDRIRTLFDAIQFEVAGSPPFHTSCSFGIAQLDSAHADGISLYEAADNSLYEAKKHGRNCVLSS